VPQTRGEFVLLELEAKALQAVDVAWHEFKTNVELARAEAKPVPLPLKLVEMIIDVHKAVMQRMNAKYGLDQTAPDLREVIAALDAEKKLVQQMLEQQELGLQ
jgi:hypothetical protein